MDITVTPIPQPSITTVHVGIITVNHDDKTLQAPVKIGQSDPVLYTVWKGDAYDAAVGALHDAFVARLQQMISQGIQS